MQLALSSWPMFWLWLDWPWNKMLLRQIGKVDRLQFINWWLRVQLKVQQVKTVWKPWSHMLKRMSCWEMREMWTKCKSDLFLWKSDEFPIVWNQDLWMQECLWKATGLWPSSLQSPNLSWELWALPFERKSNLILPLWEI